jgi:gluconokinase
MRGHSVILIVMGVSGAGKSTLAAALASTLHWPMIEGDDLHPPANVEKMRRGLPLDDADRAPWMDLIVRRMAELHGAGACAVLACSALRVIYRDRLRASRIPLIFVYLRSDPVETLHRMQSRRHFMPPTLLQSQFATLEVPGSSENVIEISATIRTEVAVSEVIGELRVRGHLVAG